MSNLVIVESPAKAKTINKYLGKNYTVIASMGHLRDLPKSALGVDLEDNFKPKYLNIKGKGELINKLKSEAKKADKVFLATDPDREGEAISWHLANILGIDVNNKIRVTFNEITKNGIKEGMKNTRAINLSLVDAQQARRILDRIVGYQISPFLWRKIKPGLSAGRVQSVATKIIVDREREIEAFIPKEYWSIDAILFPSLKTQKFSSKYFGNTNGKKVEITNEEQALGILKNVEGADFVVTDKKTGIRKKTPAPPFITSTLQQEASRRLNFQSRKTMNIAQQLYEGVDVKGQGTTGLITYMRTDSVRISDEAREAGNAYILNNFGPEYLPSSPRFYKSRSNSQDGHEAIRPTIISLTPQMAKESLTNDQYRLYKLIWERFISSLMSECIQDTVSLEITANDALFKSSGFTVKFKGYTALYEEKSDDAEEKATNLPNVNIGDKLNLLEITPNQHFTEPPSRYTEASLIKILEEKGIGRPSTYAPTIATITSRNYIERDGKFLFPTNVGFVTNDLMSEHFKNIVDEKFTANMEKELDEIENNNIVWTDVIANFYDGFKETLKVAEQTLGNTKIKIPDEVTDIICDKCGKNMVIKNGRNGKFLACPGFPQCRNTMSITTEAKGQCPICGGAIIVRKSKKGKKYYCCEKYPDCTFITWDAPTGEACPKCGKSLLKHSFRGQKDIHCSNENCDYKKEIK